MDIFIIAALKYLSVNFNISIFVELVSVYFFFCLWLHFFFFMSGNFQLYTVHCGDISYQLLICYFLTKTVVGFCSNCYLLSVYFISTLYVPSCEKQLKSLHFCFFPATFCFLLSWFLEPFLFMHNSGVSQNLGRVYL